MGLVHGSQAAVGQDPADLAIGIGLGLVECVDFAVDFRLAAFVGANLGSRLPVLGLKGRLRVLEGGLQLFHALTVLLDLRLQSLDLAGHPHVLGAQVRLLIGDGHRAFPELRQVLASLEGGVVQSETLRVKPLHLPQLPVQLRNPLLVLGLLFAID